MTPSNSIIAKNTLLLYMRMLFVMGVTLYTSRIVLAQLGINDYGVYNIIGGVIAIFGGISAAMATTTQRYITFELGKTNNSDVNAVFNASIRVHSLIALIIVALSETIGLWFLYNKLDISGTSSTTAFWVFQFSIATTATIIVSVPYNAIIIAYEKMSAFAYISLIEVVLKLGIAFSLALYPQNKLILYSALIFIAQLLIRTIYTIYCRHNFKETKIRHIRKKSLIKEMFGFAGWNLWGNFASVILGQGLNLILNIFFGPIVNAARGVAFQVQGAVLQFSTNFQMAINPQITKKYSSGEIQEMQLLLCRSSRFSFILLFAISFPLMMIINEILQLWLEQVPPYTSQFIMLILCISLLSSMAQPIMQGAQASGNIKKYQVIISSILLLSLPLGYCVARKGLAPISVFIVQFIVEIVAFVVRLLIVKPLIDLNINHFFKDVIVRCITILLISAPIPFLIRSILFPLSFLDILLVITISFICASLSAFCFGLTKNERIFVFSKVKSIICHKKL